MKIDRVYIGCCQLDYYLTRICVASIRYWNESIPISLIKDLSKGEFDTSEMEKVFGVSIVPIKEPNMGGYSKLYPYINLTGERILLMDSDIVWLGNIVEMLEQYDEDIIVQGYSPVNFVEEINKWYFKTEKFSIYYKDYSYPGFLFNAGQIVFNSSVFSSDDFKGIIEWKDRLKPIVDDVFLCEDQGILNYIVAKKIKAGEVTIKRIPLYVGGWSEEAKLFNVEDIKNRKQHPLLIHWFGEKRGLVTALPNNSILKFFEEYFYSKVKNGQALLQTVRFKRTVKHFNVLMYHYCKVVYYKLAYQFTRRDNVKLPVE